MVVGILGGGQLARMLALAGLPLGLRFRFLDPSPDAVAGHVGELVVGAYDDPDALARFVKGVRLVTFEFENVPAAAARWLLDHVAVHPHPRALEVGQDRLEEKRLFERVGLAVPPYSAVATLAEFQHAVARLGRPCIAKTRRLGYDGKGQRVLRDGTDLVTAFSELTAHSTSGLLVERLVAFDRELSILAVRSTTGETAIYPLVENRHVDGMLRLSKAPAARVPPELAREAERVAKAVLEMLDYVGVLAIELFEQGGKLLGNELAPRVHNSGHWTIEGSVCSQFENHLRAVLGWPLGSTQMTLGGSARMVNLVGEEPNRADLLAVPGARVHLYGKAAKAGRKLGHVTLVGSSEQALDESTRRIEELAAQALR